MAKNLILAISFGFKLNSNLKHGASPCLKFKGLNLSVVIIFKTFH